MLAITRTRRSGRGTGYLRALGTVVYAVIVVFVFITGTQARPLHILQDPALLSFLEEGDITPLEPRASAQEGEVNPVKVKNPTRPDPGMRYPNLNVLTENKTTRYDDEKWSLTATEFQPGMFYGRLGVGNGLVFSFLFQLS